MLFTSYYFMRKAQLINLSVLMTTASKRPILVFKFILVFIFISMPLPKIDQSDNEAATAILH